MEMGFWGMIYQSGVKKKKKSYFVAHLRIFSKVMFMHLRLIVKLFYFWLGAFKPYCKPLK